VEGSHLRGAGGKALLAAILPLLKFFELLIILLYLIYPPLKYFLFGT